MQDYGLRLPAIPRPYAALFPYSARPVHAARAQETAQPFTLVCRHTGGETI